MGSETNTASSLNPTTTNDDTHSEHVTSTCPLRPYGPRDETAMRVGTRVFGTDTP